MADLLRKGRNLLDTLLQSNVSSSASYRKVGTTDAAGLAALEATIGASRGSSDQLERLGIQFDQLDFIIRLEPNCTSDGTETPFGDWLGRDPEIGDEITFEGVVYAVTADEQEGKAWRYTSGYRTAYRIHTKHVATV